MEMVSRVPDASRARGRRVAQSDGLARPPVTTSILSADGQPKRARGRAAQRGS